MRASKLPRHNRKTNARPVLKSFKIVCRASMWNMDNVLHFTRYLNVKLILILSVSSAFTQGNEEAIAIVSAGESLTHLRIIRSSPKMLLSRLDHRRVGQFESIALESMTSHKWVGLAHDVRRQEYYILDTASRQFLLVVDDPFRRNITSVILNGISPKVKAMAYDWLRRELYWTDPSYQAIFRIPLNHPPCSSTACVSGSSWRQHYGKKTRSHGHKLVVIHTVVGVGLVNPCGLALDPNRRMMYWADDGTVSSLHASSLSGHNRSSLLQSLVRPAGLTLDYTKNRLYWLERLSGLSVIRWCRPSNGVCVPHTASEEVKSQLNDLDYHQDFLIMSDISQNRLIVFEESTDRLFRQHLMDKPYSIVMSSISRQPGIVKPQVDIDPRDDVFQNIFEKGVVIIVSEKRGILLVDRTFAMGDYPRDFHVLVSVTGITRMAADVIRQRLYFFVKEKKIIYRVSLPSTITPSHEPAVTAVVTSWIDDVTGMAVDWATGNLYWVDSGYQRIMMSRGTGHFPHVLHHQNVSSPRDLVIHSKHRIMFWSDSNDDDPRIERSDLDGTHRMVILSKNSFYQRPYALALDLRRESLYYSDGPFLCRCTLTGNILGDCKRRDLALKAAVKAIDIMHDYILWTDFIGGLVSADIDVDFPLDHNRKAKQFPDLYFGDVIYFHHSRQPAVLDPCDRNFPFSAQTFHAMNLQAPDDNNEISDESRRGHRGCSHLCIPSGRGHRCACEVGYWLKQDGTCVPGVLYDRFLMFGDLKTKRLFRQFALLPDYYVIESKSFVYPSDLAVDEQAERICWLDDRKNLIFCSDFNGKHKAVVFAALDFNITKIIIESQHRLLYILTSSGHVIVLSLASGRYVYIIKDTNLPVISLAIDVLNRLAVRSQKRSPELVSIKSQSVIVSTDMEGLHRKDFYQSNGKPISLAFHDNELYWIDGESKVIYSYPADTSSTNSTPQRPNYKASTRYRYVERKRKLEAHRRRLAVVVASLELRRENDDRFSSLKLPVKGTREQKQRRDAEKFQPIDSDENDVNGPKARLRTVCRLNPSSNPRNLVITPDGDIFFTDEKIRTLLRTHVNGSQVARPAGFPYLNQIHGLAYFDKRNKGRPRQTTVSCNGILLPRANGKASCVCDVKDRVPRCRDRRHALKKVAKKQGLCLIEDVRYGRVDGGEIGTYVMPGEKIHVTCRPGYLMSTSRHQNETRMCQGERWNSTAVCSKAYGYDVIGDQHRGYVIFNKSMTFIVPSDVRRVDVICIGGGGGGFDSCSRVFSGTRMRAGMGGVSKFGRHVRAHGGQGGAKADGGRGGRGRNLFGGSGSLSSDCQGGGAAGETKPAVFCRLSSTSCPFCGAGGALRECARCPRRPGGCGGPMSQPQNLEAADDYGGGATGASGGGGGGGGGFSRKSVRVFPFSKIPVTVGRRGSPSARPAGNGVVVVAWGGVIERQLDSTTRNVVCKSYKLISFDDTTCNRKGL